MLPRVVSCTWTPQLITSGLTNVKSRLQLRIGRGDVNVQFVRHKACGLEKLQQTRTDTGYRRLPTFAAGVLGLVGIG